jgi:hypothetical protein
MYVSGRTIVEEFELIRHAFEGVDEPSFQRKRCPPGIHVIRRTSSPPALLLPLTSHPPRSPHSAASAAERSGGGARVPCEPMVMMMGGGGGPRKRVMTMAQRCGWWSPTLGLY